MSQSVKAYLPLQQPLRNKEDYQNARNLLAYVFQHYGNEPLMMFINEPFVPKTGKQNRKAHAMIADIAEATGNDAGDLKEYFMSEEGAGWFLDETVTVLGKEVRRRQSFANLNKEQTEYFIGKLDAFAAEQNIVLRNHV